MRTYGTSETNFTPASWLRLPYTHVGNIRPLAESGGIDQTGNSISRGLFLQDPLDETSDSRLIFYDEDMHGRHYL